MKLISSSGKGKRVANKRTVKKNNDNKDSSVITERSDSPAKRKGRSGRMSKKKKIIVITSCILGLMLVLGISTFAVVRWQIQPFYTYFFRPSEEDLAKLPGVIFQDGSEQGDESPKIDGIDDNDGINNNEDGRVDEVTVSRDTSHVNFLLLGIDEHGNTDVIMLAAFNTEKSTLDVVSIPRDTMVNVSWDLRKANSIHAYMRNKHRNDNNRDEKIAESTIEHFRDVFGFHADYMVTVGFNGFIRLIDAVGPISYNVPVSVNEMGISVPRGNQRLNGRQALAVMRSRRSYANHAIGRDYAQQEFLAAVASTVISANWNASKITDMVDVFFRHVNTSIPINYLVGFGRDFMHLNKDNINFHMMPGAIDTARGNSYITILVDEWLELLNENFNPFSRDLTVQDVSILTRGPDLRLMVTDGNWQGSSSWGSNSLGSRNPSLTTDSTRPVPGRAPPAQLADDGGDRNPVTGGTGGGGDDTGTGGGGGDGDTGGDTGGDGGGTGGDGGGGEGGAGGDD